MKNFTDWLNFCSFTKIRDHFSLLMMLSILMLGNVSLAQETAAPSSLLPTAQTAPASETAPSSVEEAQSALTAQQKARVENAIARQMEKQQLVGLAVGIVRNGRPVYLQGFGYENREEQIPVTRQTMFRWASISKPITAVAAMQLVEEGKLDLKKDVRTYVPEFPEQEHTIHSHHLLCHQSGIVHYRNGKVVRTRVAYDEEHPYRHVVLALDRFKESPLVSQPGEKFSYTTHGYILLSAVVERAGGEPFAALVAGRIFEPAGMTTIRPDYQWEAIAHRAVGYKKFGDMIVPSTDTDVSWKLGGGGFISNIDDLARFAAAMINDKLVTRETRDAMWKAQKTADGKKVAYGLGFQVRSGRAEHGGSQEKAKTYMSIRHKSGDAVVVMSNSEYAVPLDVVNALWKALDAKDE